MHTNTYLGQRLLFRKVYSWFYVFVPGAINCITESKKAKYDYDDSIYYQLTLFELESPQYDEEKAKSKGKIFTLTRDTNASGNIDIDDLEWHYLEGDGDFRSPEVKALRDEVRTPA